MVNKILYVLIVSPFLALSACGNTNLKIKSAELQIVNNKKTNSNASDATVGAASNVALPPNVKTEKEEISGTSFRVKGASQLRSSIESCFGEKVLLIKETMIQKPSTSSSANEKVTKDHLRFLNENYLVNEDIVQKLAQDLFDPSTVVRTSTSANAPSQSYLSALAVVGDVVAHNCDLNSEKCDCRTESKSLLMIQRCVPHLNEEKTKKASEIIFKGCRNGGLQQRKVLAGFVASMLFSEQR